MTTISMPHSSLTSQANTLAALPPLRVGAVSYLNSKPLIEGLDELLGFSCTQRCESAAPNGKAGRRHQGCKTVCERGGELTLDVPSRLADDLAAGELDVALIPSVEALTGEGYQIISDACVAARGPVRSVKLYSRVPVGQIHSLALDEGSRTSAALTRTILHERYGVEPELRPFPLGSSLDDCDADAILMIGDRAMHEPSGDFADTWDLGEHWFRWTGRPFVFAVWVARDGIPTDRVSEVLTQARDRGVASIAEIAGRDAAGLGLTAASAESYLRRNLHFYFRRPERASLELFQQLATSAGVI